MNKILLGNDVNCAFDNGTVILTDKGANIIRLDVEAYTKLEHFVQAQMRNWKGVEAPDREKQTA